MKNFWKKLTVLLTAAILALTLPVFPVMASQIPPEEMKYTPTVISPLNSASNNVVVFGFKDTTLHVECGGKSLAKVKYSKREFKNVKIKPQKAGAKMRFYLVTSYGKKGKVVTRTVLNLAQEKLSSKLKAPNVQKNIDNRTTTVRVSAQKNTTLMVKDDKAKILVQQVFKKNGYQNVKVNIPKNARYLYFYEKTGNRRSKITTRKVLDKIAPDTPVIIRDDDMGARVNIKGELGTYILANFDGKWFRCGAITDKNGFWLMPTIYNGSSNFTYKIMLKDMAGNSSKAVVMEFDGHGTTVNIPGCGIDRWE